MHDNCQTHILSFHGMAHLFEKVEAPRRREAEGEMDSRAAASYNTVTSWLPFKYVSYVTLQQLSALPLQGNLIDIGCGPGYLTFQISKRFPGLNVIGLDINPDMLKIANSKMGNQLDLLQGNVEQLPFTDHSFNCVVTTLAMHHWVNAAKALGEIYRILQVGGNLLIFDLRRDARYWFYVAMAAGQFLAPWPLKVTNGGLGSLSASYTLEEIQDLFAVSPFKFCKMKESGGWLIIKADK